MKRLTWLAVLTFVACAAPMPMPTPVEPGMTVPDFQLTDVNLASSTARQQVGPKTYEGKITGWYFGHSS